MHYWVAERWGRHLECLRDLLARLNQLWLQLNQLLLHHVDVSLRRKQLLEADLVAALHHVDLRPRQQSGRT